ncbi:Biphenyl dioxygenase subunit beta [bacterium HR10]|nr:Biphenyl dioxygenase subunit beta [bacterium HR10]
MRDLALRWEIEEFLIREAELLDEGALEQWLELFTEDAHYEMPLRVGREEGDELSPMRLFDETLPMLRHRVNRVRTKSAWAERPPSRTRRFVSNIWVEPISGSEEVRVRSAVLLYRNRGVKAEADLLSAVREDRLRRVNGQWKIAHRRVLLDSSTVPSDNLSIFL